MDETPLYQQIAESIRREILEGRIKPGDRLPSVRELKSRWLCTPGTIQRAYSELSRQGLIISRPGQGTRVIDNLSIPSAIKQAPLRRAGLVHKFESFLLELITAGYSISEIQQAAELAIDRWRALSEPIPPTNENIIRFVGSHDMALNMLVDLGRKRFPLINLDLVYTGSLGGLMALAEKRADIAGCHLWDSETDTYNIPFIRKLLPGKKTALVNFTFRNIGLMVQPGNPQNIHSLKDLVNPNVVFLNRQAGSGTRVWLDAQLNISGIGSDTISGYSNERLTHSEVARGIAEGTANTGLGLEAAASAYGLDFIDLTQERYDLVIPEEQMMNPQIIEFIRFLAEEKTKDQIAQLPGYDPRLSGTVEWVT